MGKLWAKKRAVVLSMTHSAVWTLRKLILPEQIFTNAITRTMIRSNIAVESKDKCGEFRLFQFRSAFLRPVQDEDLELSLPLHTKPNQRIRAASSPYILLYQIQMPATVPAVRVMYRYRIPLPGIAT